MTKCDRCYAQLHLKEGSEVEDCGWMRFDKAVPILERETGHALEQRGHWGLRTIWCKVICETCKKHYVRKALGVPCDPNG